MEDLEINAIYFFKLGNEYSFHSNAGAKINYFKNDLGDHFRPYFRVEMYGDVTIIYEQAVSTVNAIKE